jgi:hypothetical protein
MPEKLAPHGLFLPVKLRERDLELRFIFARGVIRIILVLPDHIDPLDWGFASLFAERFQQFGAAR